MQSAHAGHPSPDQILPRGADPTQADTPSARKNRRSARQRHSLAAVQEGPAACIARAWLPDRVSDQTTLGAITRVARGLGTDLAWYEPVGR